MPASRTTALAVIVTLMPAAPAIPAFGQPATIRVSVNRPEQTACNLTLPPDVHSCVIRLETTPSLVHTARFKVVADIPLVWYGTPPGQEYYLTFTPCIGGGGTQMENFGIQTFGAPQTLTLQIVPATGYSEIELTDCAGNAMTGAWTCEGPVATESSTWGRVKALFRN